MMDHPQSIKNAPKYIGNKCNFSLNALGNDHMTRLDAIWTKRTYRIQKMPRDHRIHRRNASQPTRTKTNFSRNKSTETEIDDNRTERKPRCHRNCNYSVLLAIKLKINSNAMSSKRNKFQYILMKGFILSV